VGCGGGSTKTAQEGGDKGVKVEGGANEADITISATELYAAYKTDPKAADQRFKGKRLAVSGTVGLRDDNPKGFSKMIRLGLKGSPEKNEFVVFLFPWEYERYFHRLDAKPQPPIIGTCEGAATSEYGKKKDARPMEVRFTQCVIPEVPGAKTPYDRGFEEGHRMGLIQMKEFKTAPKIGRENIEKMLAFYTNTQEIKAKLLRTGGVFPSDVDKAKGTVDGYRKAVEASGVK
jgi:hypothetical protein